MRFLAEAPEDLFFLRLFLYYYLFVLDRSTILYSAQAFAIMQDPLFP